MIQTLVEARRLLPCSAGQPRKARRALHPLYHHLALPHQALFSTANYVRGDLQ